VSAQPVEESNNQSVPRRGARLRHSNTIPELFYRELKINLIKSDVLIKKILLLFYH